MKSTAAGPARPHLLQRLPVGGELLRAAGQRRHGRRLRAFLRGRPRVLPGASPGSPPPAFPAGRRLGVRLRHAGPRRGGGNARGAVQRPAGNGAPLFAFRCWAGAARAPPGGQPRGEP